MAISAPRSPKKLIKASGIPYTVIRSTQFREFLGAIATSSADGNTVRISPGLFQPIAADDVAAIVADVALAAPRNGIVSTGTSATDTAFSDPVGGTALFAASTPRRLDGAIGGAQAGYNWIGGILLAGVEGDLNYSGQRAKLNVVCPGAICNPALIGVSTIRPSSPGSSRARSSSGSRSFAPDSALPSRRMPSLTAPVAPRSGTARAC